MAKPLRVEFPGAIYHGVDVHPEAVAEAQAAAQWYRERSALAADAFLAELDRAVERIAESPGLNLT